MRSLAIASLGIRGFRNLAQVDVELGARFNVVFGDNGQGKTNLLEAAYILATSRSFRTSKIADLVATGGETASIRARVVETDDNREQSVGLRSGMRATRIDGKRPPTLAAYALRTPTVVFHPGSLSLSAGGGAERRKLLDRIALYVSPASLAEAESYGKALRARQRVLESRGEAAGDLDGWEELVVRHGTALTAARADAASRLVPAAERAFGRIGPPGMTLGVRYESGAPPDPEAFRAELARRRSKDRARGSATVGPHRDDVVLALSDLPVRAMASQGQHRAVVLALQLAEIAVVTESRGVRPVLLLDDVSSELDRERTRALLTVLREGTGQVLITTTRPELIDAGGLAGDAALPGEPRAAETRRFHVVGGSVTPV